MPEVIAEDGTRIHYDVWGAADKPPLLMIQGLGADQRGWFRQRRALAPAFRCLVIDNRGVGGSDAPPGPYDLEVMAADAVAVLDHAEVESAHVMGASMGGVLTQIIGVRHPERARSLVLACTACRHLQWRRDLLTEWKETALAEGMGAFITSAARWLVGPRSLRRMWPALGLLGPLGPLAMGTPPEAFAAQVDAILALDDDVRFELGSIRLPTLALVGSQDILTPLGDSEEIASFIPGAELAVVGGGAHGFMFEHAAAFNRTVRSFLDRVVAADEGARRESSPAEWLSPGPEATEGIMGRPT